MVRLANSQTPIAEVNRQAGTDPTGGLDEPLDTPSNPSSPTSAQRSPSERVPGLPKLDDLDEEYPVSPKGKGSGSCQACTVS